jgi:hypothetical protein
MAPPEHPAPQPQPTATAPGSPPRTAPRWILPIVAAGLALLVGIIIGWFGHQAWISYQISTAADDIAAEMEQGVADMPAIPGEEGGEPAEEPTGPPEPDSPDDGLFSYEVVSVDRADSYNDEDCASTYRPSGGEFVVVTLAAENIGSAAAVPAVDPGTVTGYDAEGTSYSTHMDICSFADETNPGNSTEYDVVFDVPADTQFEVFELSAYDSTGFAVIPAE